MPLFEFVCEDCGKEFEELVRSAFAVTDVECPTCKSALVHKKISKFAARISGSIGAGISFGNTASSCSTGST